MNQLVLNVGFAFFPYGGNGGTSSEVPDIRDWTIDTILKARSDSRVGKICRRNFSDTPITMTRNAAVLWARENDVDVLVMVDSDMCPDCEKDDDPNAKPFWDSSFQFIYENWSNGPNVVCAPYCGPPPTSPVYVFKWASTTTEDLNIGMKMQMYGREEAEQLSGIHPAAALPTGLIMFDMRAFELTDPKKLESENGWFYYEWPDCYSADKHSTEDVTATRDMSFQGWLEKNKDVIYCNWDSWAGHWKPLCVRKPRSIKADYVADKFRKAVLRDQKSIQSVNFIRCNTEDGGAKPARVLQKGEMPAEYDIGQK